MLQWGRNFIVAETPVRASEPEHNQIASMGPQLYRCGNRTCRCRVPLPARCFNGATTLSLRKLAVLVVKYRQYAKLQWGRNFIVAETTLPNPTRALNQRASMGPQLYRCGNQSRIRGVGPPDVKLQWGRNFIVAETCSEPSIVSMMHLLQWGRNFIVAETPSTMTR